MVSYSLSDLKLISVFKDMSEFEMLEISNDNLMAEYLYKLGMDVPKEAFMYFPSFHRNLQNQIVLGFTVAGEVRQDEAYRNSWMCSMTEKLLLACNDDVGLMREMTHLNYKVRDMESYLNHCDSEDYDLDRALFPEDQLEPLYLENEAQIENLQSILEGIRGPMYGNSGALKTFKEYKDFAKEKYGN